MPSPLLLEASGAVVGYRGRPVLEPVSVGIGAGRLVSLLGANGSGKSTLLRTFAGLQPPLGGTIRWAEQALAGIASRARARLLALVLTDRVSAPAMRGYDLVALGRQPHTGWSGRLSADDHESIARALDETKAEGLADRLVAELSDGERQRLLVARALAQEPRILVLDEPTAFLDLPRRVELMHLLRHMARVRQLAVLVSTHDLELALRYSDEIWLLDRDGVAHTGAPEDLVLSGQFEKAFLQHGLAFDVDRGVLRIVEETHGAIAVAAEGRTRHWLCHAVQRAGFHVDKEASVRIEQDGDEYRVLEGDILLARANSVGSIVAHLVEKRSGI